MPPARAVVIGLLIGTLPSLFIRSLIQVTGVPRRELPMTVVVVTTKALPAGHVLTMDDVTQVSLPAPLVTASLVKPQDVSYVINQKLLVPLSPRDPLPWGVFETMATIEGQQPAKELVEACSAEMKRRKVPGAPDSVSALRAAILEAR